MNIKFEPFFTFIKRQDFLFNTTSSKGREAKISIFQPGSIKEPIKKVSSEIP